MKTMLVNHRTGHIRRVRGSTAFLGAAFFGSFYFLAKGVWTWFFIWTAVTLANCAVIYIAFAVLAQTAPGPSPALAICLALYLAPALFAARIVRRFFKDRGYAVEAPLPEATS